MVAVDPPARHQLLQELRRQRLMPLFGDVPQGVLQSQLGVLPGQVEMSRWGTPNALSELGSGWQLGEQLPEMNFHGLGDVGVGVHDYFPWLEWEYDRDWRG